MKDYYRRVWWWSAYEEEVSVATFFLIMQALPTRTHRKTPDRFLFYSRSPDAPPGLGGVGVNRERGDPHAYGELATIPHWRRALSNFWTHVGPQDEPNSKNKTPIEPLFELEGKQWASVEHYFHAAKFRAAANVNKKQGVDFVERYQALQERYLALAWDGKWGRTSGAEARSRGGKSKAKGYALTQEELGAWSRVHYAALRGALQARFSQDALSKRILLATGSAILDHVVIIRGQPSRIAPQHALMEVRGDLLNKL